MIVWRDTQTRTMATPAWLPADVARCHSDQGDLVTLPRYAALLGWRPDAAWVDAGDGWQAALYAEFVPGDYLRPLHWALVATVIDARGRPWVVPAILWPSESPIVPGPPTVAMARKLTPTGWMRYPLDQTQQAAIETCLTAFRHLGDLAAVDLATSSDWLAAILECTHFGGPLTFAALGLLDDVLAQHALRLACGFVGRDGYQGIAP